MTTSITHAASFESLLSTKQAALRLGTSERFLEIRRMKGGGPQFIRVLAKTIRYRQSDLDSWVAARAFQSTSDQGL